MNSLVKAKRAAALCGFDSVAMLDYLQRMGVFVPTGDRSLKRGRGRARTYSFRDLLVLKAISALLKSGASVLLIKKALIEFQRRKWHADEASLQGEDGSVIRYLTVSGDRVLFAKSVDRLYDLTDSGQMVFTFVLDIDRLHTELCFHMRQSELPMPGLAG